FTSRRLRGLDVLRGVQDRNGGEHVLGKTDLRACGTARADRLHGEAVAEDSVVAYLVELASRQLQAWGAAQVHGLPTPNLDVEPLVAAFHERAELIDGEVVLHPAAELLGHVARIVSEGLRCVLGPPAAVLVLQILRQVPVVQRREWLDAGSL